MFLLLFKTLKKFICNKNIRIKFFPKNYQIYRNNYISNFFIMRCYTMDKVKKNIMSALILCAAIIFGISAATAASCTIIGTRPDGTPYCAQFCLMNVTGTGYNCFDNY